MKFQFKEQQILVVVTIILGLVDFFMIPFKSLLVTSIFAIILFILSKSLFLVTLVFISPLLIQFVNKLLNVQKQGFTTNPTEIATRVNDMKHKFSKGENLNPETPTKPQLYVDEYFTDLLEVSKRVEDIQNQNKESKNSQVSGIVDKTLPIGVASLQGVTTTPAFMEQFENMGTNVNTNTRIFTPNEPTVPALGTMDKYPIQHPAIEKLDTDGVNTALMRTTNNNSTNTLKGVDMNASTI